MHIVLVNRWYPPHTGFGGVAMYHYYLAHALAELGQRVSVVASRPSEAVPAKHQDRATAIHRLLAKEHYILGRLPVFGRYARPLLQFLYSRQVCQFLNDLSRSDPFDLVEFAEINAEGYYYIRQKHRPPVVVRCHTPTFILKKYHTHEQMPYDTSWTERMEKECIFKADALSAPSKDTAQTVADAMDIDSNRFTVIPNPLDTRLFSPPETSQKACSNDVSRFSSSRKSSSLPQGSHSGYKAERPNTINIIHVGRLDRVKGIAVLAQAIPLVLQQAPDTHFTFIGEDRSDGQGSTWRQQLESQFQSQGTSGQVHLLGSVDLAALIDEYHRSDIAVVPTLNYESFSYTCAQAMSAGLPLVASRIGGIPETVGEAGCLVAPGDVQELAGVIVRLAKDPAERSQLGLAARQRACRFFDASPVAEQILAFYRNLTC